MAEEAVAMVVEASVVAVAILVALPAMASQLTEERILQRTVGTEVTTGTEVATGAAVPTGAGTEIPIRMIIRTTDGIVGPETRKAISWFQSVDKLSVSGRIGDPTLKALQIS
jgi:peptidoglycan hydrolase-like protein with peptidoglycan-binding domain